MISNTENYNHWMCLALEQAKIAQDNGEVPIGAVIIKDNKLISSGYNQPIKSKKTTYHAEIIAIEKACEVLNNYRLENTKIFVTIQPCMMCLGAIYHARIPHLIYGSEDSKKQKIYEKESISKYFNLNHNLTISGNILNKKCSKILRDFFYAKRKLKI